MTFSGKSRFFIEVQEHDATDMPDVRDKLIVELAKKTGVGLVATNDVHFLNEEDYEAHDALCCINTGKKVSDEPERLKYPPSVYLKSADQMRELFADVPQACDNTLKIAERCNVELDLSSRACAGLYACGRQYAGGIPDEAGVCRGEETYGKVTEEIKQRIERELSVIEGKGFSSYFLIAGIFVILPAK